MVSNDNPGGVEDRGGKGKKLVPLLTIVIVIVISVTLYFFSRDPAVVARLRSYGYAGTFLISLIGNATIFLPGVVLPILTGFSIVLFPVTGLLGPIIIGLTGGTGAALGEIVGYTAGYSGRGVLGKSHIYRRLVAWVERWGSLAIFIFALVPLFFDLVGLAAGALRFPLWKFILVCWLGRTIMYVFVMMLASLGWESVFLTFIGVGA